MRRITRLLRGALTVANRRGLGYFRYLLTGVVVPRMTYRLVWGPEAPAVVRRLFRAAVALEGHRPSAHELRMQGLLADGGPCLPADRITAAEVELLMVRAHASGITGVAGSFDRVVAIDGGLRFAVLANARAARKGSACYLAGRDADREAFNKRFGATLLTEASARQALRAMKRQLPANYREYAPIDFGSGLSFGRIASTDSGTGRWDYLNRSIVAPLVEGRRVLDLGCNNGSLSLMMARAGAREVVGLELSPAIADFARLNAKILCWRDDRPYPITIRTADMRVFLEQDVATFDVVTAFCSLYYLPQRDMAAIIGKAAEMGAILILQANEAIGSNRPGTRRDLERMMRENGYPDPELHAPTGFSRPILVGRAPGSYAAVASRSPTVAAACDAARPNRHSQIPVRP